MTWLIYLQLAHRLDRTPTETKISVEILESHKSVMLIAIE